MNLPIERIIEELSRPEAYPHPVDRVELIQTHISLVFMAGERVYKVKKPVDFGFLDFTTLDKRRHFCEEELRLNRRLTSEVYLEVTPVTEGPAGLRFGGGGAGVEYAVVMKRLDTSRLLSSLLSHGKVGRPEAEDIAHRIARFHLEAETSEKITRIGGTKGLVLNTEENFEQIEPYIGETLSGETYDTVALYTRTFIDTNRDLFNAREAEGWIRDGHGDLHTEHICMTDPIQIFDCIEFNERFRYGDILIDAAFLAMDLQRRGHADLARWYARAYLQQVGQDGLGPLMNFYACYRAVVRGKVEGFRSRDPNISGEEARQARENAGAFHLLALVYARNPVPPLLIAGCGLMGSGKSTLATGLTRHLDLEILSSDRIRKEMAGMDPATPHHVPFGSDIYSRGFSARTYTELHRRAEAALSRGRSVFLDASYMDAAMRSEAVRTAETAGARFLLIHMDASEDVLRTRLRARRERPGEVSDGREEILAQQIRTFQPPGELPGKCVWTLEAGRPGAELVRETYRRLLSTT